MGYSITAISSIYGDSAYFHYPETEQDRPLLKALSMNWIKDNDRRERTFSLGHLLQAKSELLQVSNTLDEQDFLDKAIASMKELNYKSITIIFN